MTISVFHLNYSDINGGAARACNRIHQSLRSIGVESSLLVNVSATDDDSVHCPGNDYAKGLRRIKGKLITPITTRLKTKNTVLHSLNILPSRWPEYINSSDVDIVNLHWVQAEMLSIYDISRIKKPMVWTLHDMWAFCGAEHYTTDFRWREGYRSNNRPSYEAGVDLNLLIWKLKRYCWKLPIQIICPSQWLKTCVETSALMKGWPVKTIPNTIDTDHWSPIERNVARQLANLPPHKPLVLFGAIGGSKDSRKGFDLLIKALHFLKANNLHPDMELVVIGQSTPKDVSHFNFPIHFLGHIHDDISLRVLYSAANVVLLPSRQDNLPNIGLEAQACGTPLVAFATCGMSDLIDHCSTGYLAEAFNPMDFAKGIEWAINYSLRDLAVEKLHKLARDRWGVTTIAMQYKHLYEEVIARVV